MNTLTQITPDMNAWGEFLALSYVYIGESWPDAVHSISKEDFLADYDCSLRQRLAEGGRGLFLFADGGKTIGLANVYLEQKDFTIVNLAEFYIVPEIRRQGRGQNLLYLIEQWGRKHRASMMSAEVDKEQSRANHFWSKIEGINLNDKGERNVYSRIIDPIRLVWIRHAPTCSLAAKGVFPTEDEIIVSEAGQIQAAGLRDIFLDIARKADIYCSPLRRAILTLDATFPKWNFQSASVKVIDGLREFIPNELIGMPINEIKERYGADCESLFLSNPTQSPFTRSESVLSAQARVVSAGLDIVNDDRPSTVRILLGHGTLHAIFVQTITGEDLGNIFQQQLEPMNGSVFSWDHVTQNWTIECLNRSLGEIAGLLSTRRGRA